MKLQRFIFAYLPALLILTVGCSAPNGERAASSDTSSIHDIQSSESSPSISSSGSLSTPSNPSSLPVRTASSSNSTISGSPSTSFKPSSNSTSAILASETKSLVFAEDDHTKAIFHIGMTREQVKKALKDNQLRIKPDDYGTSDEEMLNELGFGIIGGVDISFDSKTGLLNQLTIFPVSDTEFSSPYETEKGLKIGDTVETVIKRYGEPLEKSKGGDAVNEDLFLAYCYDLPINLNDYYKQCKEIVGPDNSSVSKKRGAHLRIDVSQMKGDNFNRVDSIVYYADSYGHYLR